MISWFEMRKKHGKKFKKGLNWFPIKSSQFDASCTRFKANKRQQNRKSSVENNVLIKALP